MNNELAPQQGIVLYSHPDDHYSHRIRLALAEKNVKYQLVLVDEFSEDVADLNPYNQLPTLVERQVRLYESHVILEYLDERYRQAKLLPDTPNLRAEQRQYAWRIEQDWMKLADILLRHPDTLDEKAAREARHSLSQSLVSLSPLFSHFPFFMSEQFGYNDCILAPLLWRLPQMQIHLPSAHCKPLLAYCKRLFERPAFIASLTESERHKQQNPLYR
ncbi:glutathione S-transferase N-terminal domain-containing protein [Alkanindiges illinoisensis]|uniref:glutathione S-transferase N-terminal domain-containing protein n=1 Tax=Alkanindiges illinoisensis TaxID=197183 RepID=UPI00047E4C02|nr:glutathione S-transferase N-terminal domain-containing protein [Alkanindiges illinoisensis]